MPLTTSPLTASGSVGSVAKAICVAMTSFFNEGVVADARERSLAESVKVLPSVVSETARAEKVAFPLAHAWDVAPERMALPDWTAREALPV